MASAAVANMLSVHRALRTWSQTVSMFIVPTEFAREKFIEGGFPAGRIAVKPNFVNPDPGWAGEQVGMLSSSEGYPKRKGSTHSLRHGVSSALEERLRLSATDRWRLLWRT